MIEKNNIVETLEQKNVLTKNNVHGAFSPVSADQQTPIKKSSETVATPAPAEQLLDAPSSTEKVEQKNLKTGPNIHNAFAPGEESPQLVAPQPEIVKKINETTPAKYQLASDSPENVEQKYLEPQQNVHNAFVTSSEVQQPATAETEIAGQKVEVHPMEKRFSPDEEANAVKAVNEAWNKLAQSDEGKALLQKAGGRVGIEKMMEEKGDFATKVATLGREAGLDEAAIGRNTHRLAELHTLEKHPADVLNGTRLVEQRIDFLEDGNKHHIELDDVVRRGEKVYLRDYKPIDLSNFEKTNAGSKWADWMRDNVGEDFRERIEHGLNPFVQQETGNAMPTDIRHALRDYLRDETAKHQTQLEKYRKLYAASTGSNVESIKTSVRPYFKYS